MGEQLNPELHCSLWDNDKAAELVRSHFPCVWEVWDSLSALERVDVFSYAVVYVIGGVYADLDVECFRLIDTRPQSTDATGIVGIEAVLDDEEEMRRY